MYNKNANSDLLSAVVVSALGAGVVTSFAISQGQHPVVALLVTGIAVTFAVLCNRSGLV